MASLAEVFSCPQKDDSKPRPRGYTLATLQTAKIRPQEAEAFRGWLRATRRAAVDAAKEGGFVGFGRADERREAADAGPAARRAQRGA